LATLGLPLVVCLIGIGWYNWTRFGSVTETGFTYSLAHQDMLLHRDDLFSPIYIIQNLYNYILNPPIFIEQFPFFKSQGTAENIVALLYSLPEVYRSQPITGLLYFAPFTVFAGIPIIMSFKKMYPATAAEDDKLRSYNSINVTLLGTFFSAFFFLLIFFWSALRYVGDFMPEIILVSVMGFWQGHQLLEPRPLAQKIYSLLGIFLAATGTVMSILIALSANQYS
jgi:hypothetical protein